MKTFKFQYDATVTYMDKTVDDYVYGADNLTKALEGLIDNGRVAGAVSVQIRLRTDDHELVKQQKEAREQ